MNILIFVYDNVEVLDFAGPFEVFSTASRICDDKNIFNVYLISEKNKTVFARNGFNVIPKYNFTNSIKPDVLIIPGGIHYAEMKKKNVLKWIFDQSKKCKITASVCTGVFILAAAGVITHQTVTTHWDDIDELKNSFPELTVKENTRWIDEGHIVTSAGISAGIDMALHLVEKIHSLELAKQTAKVMEFDWKKRN